ncbi:MAG: hypothetical protein AAF718_13360 [Pseudomonadota bacterium]
MADSASDPNVEDVLSSVRRLVSQEIPKRTPPNVSKGDGALVLTSKDRIEAEHSKRVSERSLEQRIAELEAAVDKSSSDFEPDGSEDQAQHTPDRIVYTRPRSSEADASAPSSSLRLSEIALIETGPAQESDTVDDAPVQFRHASARPVTRETNKAPTGPLGTPEPPVVVPDDRGIGEDDALTLGGAPEAPMAEDVPTLPGASADVYAFSDPDDVVARIEARLERGGEAPETPVTEPVKPSTETATSASAEPVTQEGQVEDAADDIDEELTAAVRVSIAEEASQRVDKLAILADTFASREFSRPQPLPPVEHVIAEDTATASPPELPPLDIAQAAVLTARARALKESKDAKRGDTVQATPTEHAEAALDALPGEEAMRLLVARLIREELQGVLGEKITQSVRKLVQREVKRAIELRRLD